MATTCKCGYGYEGDGEHDCVEYLLARVDDLESRLAAAEEDSESAHRRAHAAGLEVERAHARRVEAEERAAMDRARERRRQEQERQDREWARLTGARRW